MTHIWPDMQYNKSALLLGPNYHSSESTDVPKQLCLTTLVFDFFNHLLYLCKLFIDSIPALIFVFLYLVCVDDI